jgi:beta-glucosidase
VHLEAGASQKVHFSLGDRDLSMVTEAGQPIIAEGTYSVRVGGGQPGTDAPGQTASFKVKGQLAIAE